MQFSGANLPLYIFREKQFIEILPDKMPIGIYRQENPFSSNDFQLQKGDMIYLFSDGYIDQFGHEKDEKFKKFRFIELLTQIHEQPVGVQRQKLFDTFQAWRGNVQQIDDILVLGIKI
jgi:serine phosphatase RsbU (regulator of sigma subunit)